MKKYIVCFWLFLALGINGCVRYVNVPVSSCAEPAPISKPTLVTDILTSSASDDEILKAILLDHINLKGTLDQCITILDGYRK